MTTLNTTQLTFTPSNWDTWQDVVITAYDDFVAEGIHFDSIASTLTSGDAN